jgi:hypothetical protein
METEIHAVTQMIYEELTTGPWSRNFWRAKEIQHGTNTSQSVYTW